MKKKVWDITVKDNPNRVVMGENDDFYTTDTEAYLVFNLDDKSFNPPSAVLTLENRNDGSLKNETVDVIDGLIEWEMPQRYIEHFGNWQGQLVYYDPKEGVPEDAPEEDKFETYTSAPFTFVVNAHIGDKKMPSLVEIENWEKFIREGTELIETWEDMEDLRQANEAQRQANYQELLDTGVLQTNINTKLEALEEEYAPKLTEVTTQLAQKADEVYVDSLMSNITDGSPKEVFESLADLEREYPNGATGPMLVMESSSSDGAHSFIWNGTNWLDVGVYQGKGIANNSISHQHLDFLVSTENAFDGYYIKDLALSSGTTPMRIITSDGSRLAIIPINGGSTYHIRKFSPSNRMRVGLSNQDTVPKLGDEMTSDVAKFNEGHSYVEVPTDIGEKYMVIQVSSVSEEPLMNVTEGKDYGSFIPPKTFKEQHVGYHMKPESVKSEHIANGTISIGDTNFIETGKNLFAGKFYPYAIVLHSPAVELVNAGTSTAKTAIFKMKHNKTYTVTNHGDGDRFRLASAKTLIHPNVGDGQFLDRSIYTPHSTELRSYTFTNEEDNYLYVALNNAQQIDDKDIKLQIEEGNVSTEFEKSRVVVQGVDIANINELVEVKGGPEKYLFGSFGSYYRTPDLEGVSHGDSFSLWASKIEDIYQIYDDLVTLFPNQISKRLLGYGGDEENQEDINLPIYEYFVKALPGKNSHHSDPEKIVIMAGLHGGEKSPVYSLALFISQLLKKWYEHDNLESILSNVDLKIIPIANPGGYNKHERFNNHGVDVNRNFSYNWETSTSDVKGAEPYSELETKILRDWIIENNDALAFIDYHNFLNQNTGGYLSTRSEEIMVLYSTLIRRLSNRWFHKYGLSGTMSEDVVQGHIVRDVEPMAFNEAIEQGIEFSAILEVTQSFNGVLYSSEVIERGVEAIANYVLAILDAYTKGFIE